MTLYTQVEAEDGNIDKIPAFVICQKCDKKAERNSDVEPDFPNEEKYIAYYECENGHNTKAYIKVRQ